jgi:hypothetical protein
MEVFFNVKRKKMVQKAVTSPRLPVTGHISKAPSFHLLISNVSISNFKRNYQRAENNIQAYRAVLFEM